MSDFRGHGQEKNRTGVAIGPLGQKRLVLVLRVLIDTSRGKAASKTRDDARRALRELMAVANWRTPYVMRNLAAKRCRYLRGLGYDVPLEYAMRTSIDRLAQWVDNR
jgi:hypothetical protein